MKDRILHIQKKDRKAVIQFSHVQPSLSENSRRFPTNSKGCTLVGIRFYFLWSEGGHSFYGINIPFIFISDLQVLKSINIFIYTILSLLSDLQMQIVLKKKNEKRHERSLTLKSFNKFIVLVSLIETQSPPKIKSCLNCGSDYLKT